jgi:hypothetical protein
MPRKMARTRAEIVQAVAEVLGCSQPKKCRADIKGTLAEVKDTLAEDTLAEVKDTLDLVCKYAEEAKMTRTPATKRDDLVDKAQKCQAAVRAIKAFGPLLPVEITNGRDLRHPINRRQLREEHTRLCDQILRYANAMTAGAERPVPGAPAWLSPQSVN